MALTRSKPNQDASCSRKTPTKTTVDNDDGDSGSWSYMIPDILVSIISRLGVIDFVSFSGVCKLWRTIALSNRKTFMLSREPMHLRMISTEVAKGKYCYLEDLEGRKFKTFLPNISSDAILLELVSGYLVLFERKIHDFRLVNPITRHELHFPSLPPSHIVPDPEIFRCTLVFSPTMSSWVFVFSTLHANEVSFSFSSERAGWTHIPSYFPIRDLHFFQGKIYTLNTDNIKGTIRLCEVRLGPIPSLTPLKMKNDFMDSKVRFPGFATWGEKLYVVNFHTVAFETQFEQMRIWVKPIKALKKNAFFVKFSMFNSTKLELWRDTREQYERFNIGGHYTKDMWYCPHKCLDVNLLQE